MNRTVRIIHRNLLRLRDEYHLSDAHLARMTGLSRSDVSRFTNGHIHNPSFDFLDRLCDALNVSLFDLLSDAPSMSDAYSANERDAVMRLRRMDDEQRETAERVLRALAPDA